MRLFINNNTFSDILNLKFGVFFPQKKFCNQAEVETILKNYKNLKDDFFPIPIIFGISKKEYYKISKFKIVKIFYKNNKVCDLKINNFYDINKKKYSKIIFKTTCSKHPGYKYFLNFYKFLDCDILNFNKKIINNLNFETPKKVKNKLKKFKTIVGFHTRNVPHRGHEWIHAFGLKKCCALLIQPLVGQFKKGEFKEDTLINLNRNLVNSKMNNKYIFSIYYSYPRYAGPREAMLHAIVKKNYGCTHFLVGRDHAGYKNFYKKYESQNAVFKKSKKIGIKIIKFKEPVLCMLCKKIVSEICKICKSKKNIRHISGSEIRALLKTNHKIPEILMDIKLSKQLNKNSLI